MRKNVINVHHNPHTKKKQYFNSEFTQTKDNFSSEDELIFKMDIEDEEFNNAIKRSQQEDEDILVRQLLIQQNYNDFIKQKNLTQCYFNHEIDEESEYEYSDSEYEDSDIEEDTS